VVYVVFENPAGYPRQFRRGPYESVQVLSGELFVVETRGGQKRRRCLAYADSRGWHVRASNDGKETVWKSVHFEAAGASEEV
jgi:hypothetical protein